MHSVFEIERNTRLDGFFDEDSVPPRREHVEFEKGCGIDLIVFSFRKECLGVAKGISTGCYSHRVSFGGRGKTDCVKATSIAGN